MTTPGSRPVYTSTAEGFRGAREIAALRPAAPVKPRMRSKPRREPMGRSLTFFCSNPQCDHATWAPQEQARHMAREFWEVTQALIRLAPDSSEATRLAGGFVLRDLTDEQVRRANSTVNTKRRRGEPITVVEQLWAREYTRRSQNRTLALLPGDNKCRRGHEFTPENTITRPNGSRTCRTCNSDGMRRRSRAKYWGDAEFRERERKRSRDRARERRAKASDAI